MPGLTVISQVMGGFRLKKSLIKGVQIKKIQAK